ncbi:class II aldolase, partial [Burkholderia multivorans]
SNLVKIDLAGNRIGDGEHAVNVTGFALHAAVHAARPDAVCVMHLHNTAGIAVSIQRDGLLPASQHALRFHGDLAYHDYEALAFSPAEGARLTASLGAQSAMLLRNHGLLTVGASAAAAFVGMYFAEAACAIQVRAQAGGGALRMIPQPILDGIARQSRITTREMGPEQLVWPGLLRRLDRRNPGYAS